MSDFIKIDRTTSTATHAPLILKAVSQARALKETLDAIIAIGYHNFDAGPPADFAPFEALFGVPPDKGNDLFDICNGGKNAMEGTQQTDSLMTLMNQIG
jgi:hypothetical protein